MKRFMTIFCALALFGASLSAQEADTLVVIVKHDNSGNTFFEKVGKPFKKGYKAVERGVVNGYKAVENAFVEPFCDTVSTSRMYARKYRADIGRFSIKVGYEYLLGFWGHGDGVHSHQVKCGVGFTF